MNKDIIAVLVATVLNIAMFFAIALPELAPPALGIKTISDLSFNPTYIKVTILYGAPSMAEETGQLMCSRHHSCEP